MLRVAALGLVIQCGLYWLSPPGALAGHPHITPGMAPPSCGWPATEHPPTPLPRSGLQARQGDVLAFQAENLTLSLRLDQITESSQRSPASGGSSLLRDKIMSLTTKEKLLLVNGVLLGGVFGESLAVWWNGEWEAFNVAHDGWFGSETYAGGADKLGHAYSGYVIARGLCGTYRLMGIDQKTALWMAVGGAWGTLFLMELGDGLTSWGFSIEDVLAGTVGTAFALFLETHPTADSFLDFRTEYWPSHRYLDSGKGPLHAITDYDGMKNLLAFKLSGFKALENTPLSYLEIQGGYYVRSHGYEDDPVLTRHLYVGISINLSRVFSRLADTSTKGRGFLKGMSTFLRYYQFPHTTLDKTHDFD